MENQTRILRMKSKVDLKDILVNGAKQIQALSFHQIHLNFPSQS